MRCPYCEYDALKVIDKRETSHDSIRRRRECLKCKKRFTTYEKPEIVDLRIVKKSGEREQYNKEKLLKGMLKACEKRPVTTEQINEAVREIEMELKGNDVQEVHSKIIGELIMEKLKELDKVAYIRFASVYREFQDINDFKKELRGL